MFKIGKKWSSALISGAILTGVSDLLLLQAEGKMKTKGNIEVATFAGGCFWCMEPPFQQLEGVSRVEAGYSGGDVKNPTYEQVSSRQTGHLEAVQVHFDPTKVSYQELLTTFWQNIDPTDQGGQFADQGEQYKTAIFYHSSQQKTLAERSRDELQKSGKFSGEIATQILPYKNFYLAEDYHQDYSIKNPSSYARYSQLSGRKGFLTKTWGKKESDKNAQFGAKALETQKKPWLNYVKPSLVDLRKVLPKEVYRITQENGTEPAFNNLLWDNKAPGIYVDVLSGEPLFSSVNKFDSGTGWPSFDRPISPMGVVEKPDNSLFMRRTEVRSRSSDSHLGHVFNDGPTQTGLRYCINSAALRFIPMNEMKEKGYEEF
jgi:peptide methionine sulfoxide reductase msrA/msrB